MGSATEPTDLEGVMAANHGYSTAFESLYYASLHD